VQVSLPLAASRTLTVPANALLFRAEGTRIAVVDAQGRIGLRAVTLGRNYGENVEVVDGLEGTDRMVLNPSDSLADGDIVAVAPDAPRQQQQPGASKAATPPAPAALPKKEPA
jgi:hypothetical protein